ncbi:DoxX family protein [Chitinophaga nivalis]|uniref:DoxX family protein n=1 Tax=Chitinophaga nivalis TaxID=2991709 RepID=A0ABT3IJI7_9BACT|nr:DoxX family protein [Chitinophaga nivalis]MCW3466187.1 DoxX family protein [Chitinophaga nivalis]MCW3484122.1 DoxX family protein [Chitinophaga nivalis]
MHTLLWILQGLLAAIFGYSGIMKSSQKRDKLVQVGQTGVANLSYPLIRFIGITEILGAIGIIVPQATGILPHLTAVSALGFAVIMLLAAPIHYKRHEPAATAFNIFLLLVSFAVAILRYPGGLR